MIEIFWKKPIMIKLTRTKKNVTYIHTDETHRGYYMYGIAIYQRFFGFVLVNGESLKNDK